jgi:phosphate starvation-inducible membrane PsiE
MVSVVNKIKENKYYSSLKDLLVYLLYPIFIQSILLKKYLFQ